MMFKSRRILHAFIPVISLVLAACNNTPFAGIAVPGMTSVIPKVEGDAYSIQEELKALHVINPLPYEIQPGDTFHMSVYNQSSLDANLLIAPDGTTSLPMIGILKLSGLTMEDATNLIENKLSKYLRSPLVTLSPVNVSGYYFTVFGRVNRPGNYTVSVGQTKLLDALALSGGFQTGQFNGDTVELADLDNAYIRRNGKILPVDFKKLINEGDDLNNIPVLNGDYIYIPSTMNGFIIFLGEVGHNSYVGFKDGMTLLQGLAYVNGLKTETYSSYVRVIRGGSENTVVYTVNIDHILNGKMKDFLLRANDIVYVPMDGLSKWNRNIRKILPTVQLVNLLAGPFGSRILGFFNLEN